MRLVDADKQIYCGGKGCDGLRNIQWMGFQCWYTKKDVRYEYEYKKVPNNCPLLKNNNYKKNKSVNIK
jgi:hypothetical protein